MRRRRGFVALVAGLGVATAFASVASAEVTRPRGTDLSTSARAVSEAVAVDGQTVVGLRFPRRGLAQTFVYDLGTGTMRWRSANRERATLPSAVDGRFVVGTTRVVGGPHRAFVHNLRTGKTRFLGALGGRNSRATDVDGHVLVGRASLNGDRFHGFAYDLRAGMMRDLGTLGGRLSYATAVDGDVVVGWSSLPGNATRHAFAYDLGTGRMRDLGTLGGTSGAVDVDGDTVIGWSYLADGTRRGFVYDLSTGTMGDLGLLDGAFSEAVDVDGDTVVGSASTAGGGYRGFAYDLGTNTMQELGTLGPLDTPYPADRSEADAVDGDIVVGVSGSCPCVGGDLTPESWTGFAFDLRTDTMYPLGASFPGSDASAGLAVSGGVVAGFGEEWVNDHVSGDLVTLFHHAAAWSVGVGFSRPAVRVGENAGTAQLVLQRGGDTSTPATVRYSRLSGSATPGDDFRLKPGTVTFGAGQAVRTIPLVIVDDHRREGKESIVVSVERGHPQTLMGAPTRVRVTIRPSDR